jgi:hypothetical protein
LLRPLQLSFRPGGFHLPSIDFPYYRICAPAENNDREILRVVGVACDGRLTVIGKHLDQVSIQKIAESDFLVGVQLKGDFQVAQGQGFACGIDRDGESFGPCFITMDLQFGGHQFRGPITDFSTAVFLVPMTTLLDVFRSPEKTGSFSLAALHGQRGHGNMARQAGQYFTGGDQRQSTTVSSFRFQVSS